MRHCRHLDNLTNHGHQRERRLRAEISRNSSFVSVTVGVFVLTGWSLDMEQLTNIVPGLAAHARLTALHSSSPGAALWLAHRSGRGCRALVAPCC